MADRRMFAKTIVDSDAFLDMPVTSQCLYFHLAMRADDDGFINNPKKIQRMVSCSDDDMKVLLSKRFLILFESGVIVVKHWRMNNYLRNDRYKPTVYQEELASLSVLPNGAYTVNPDPTGIPLVYQMDTSGIPDVQTLATSGTPRLGKDSIGKDSIGKDRQDCDATASQPAGTTSVEVVDEDKALYQAIWQSFLAKTPQFTSYPKESKATTRLVTYCKQYAQDDPVSFAKTVLEKYLDLTEGGSKFWREQPFTPSRLASAGVFDMVVKAVRDSEVDINTELDAIKVPF